MKKKAEEELLAKIDELEAKLKDQEELIKGLSADKDELSNIIDRKNKEIEKTKDDLITAQRRLEVRENFPKPPRESVERTRSKRSKGGFDLRPRRMESHYD